MLAEKLTVRSDPSSSWIPQLPPSHPHSCPVWVPSAGRFLSSHQNRHPPSSPTSPSPLPFSFFHFGALQRILIIYPQHHRLCLCVCVCLFLNYSIHPLWAGPPARSALFTLTFEIFRLPHSTSTGPATVPSWVCSGGPHLLMPKLQASSIPTPVPVLPPVPARLPAALPGWHRLTLSTDEGTHTVWAGVCFILSEGKVVLEGLVVAPG